MERDDSVEPVKAAAMIASYTGTASKLQSSGYEKYVRDAIFELKPMRCKTRSRKYKFKDTTFKRPAIIKVTQEILAKKLNDLMQNGELLNDIIVILILK